MFKFIEIESRMVAFSSVEGKKRGVAEWGISALGGEKVP